MEKSSVTGKTYQWGMKDYVNMQTKNLIAKRDASKIGKILVFRFPNDFGIKNFKDYLC